MIRALVLLLLLATPVAALELVPSNAVLARSETDPAGSVRLPEAPWSPGATPPVVEGRILRQAWRMPGSARTTLQLVAPLRAQLEDQGYTQVFTCADASCGGFDFRFQLDLLGEPDMHVDLGDYRYVLMRNPDAEPHAVALVASRAQSAGFLHVTQVSAAEAPPEPAEPAAGAPEMPDAPGLEADTPVGLIAALTGSGHAVLEDLRFGTGSSELAEAPYASLSDLADWLKETPSARVVLVGHTDAVGSLEANTALSRRRAAAVADRLRLRYGIDPAQLQAAGAGYLAPRASNLTEEGRALNRRVEVVLLSAE